MTVIPLIKGMLHTLRRLLFGPTFTVQYPNRKRWFIFRKEERKEIPERARWRIALQRHEDGRERCVACMLCSAACPSEAIYIEGAVNDLSKPISHGERFARVWNWDMGRCIFCGFCAEACPEEAIIMTDDYELARYTRDELIVYKADLLVPSGTPPKRVWLGFYRELPPDYPVTKPLGIHVRHERYLRRENPTLYKPFYSRAKRVHQFLLEEEKEAGK